MNAVFVAGFEFLGFFLFILPIGGATGFWGKCLIWLRVWCSVSYCLIGFSVCFLSRILKRLGSLVLD